MNYKIVFEDGTTFAQPITPKAPIRPLNAARAWRQIAIIGTVAEAAASFVSGAKYWQEFETVIALQNEDGSPKFDENGDVMTKTVVSRTDLSDWSIAGDIVDHRDGTCTAMMGRPTEVELLQAQIASMPTYEEMAEVIERGVDSINE